jgi:hypothetical protein
MQGIGEHMQKKETKKKEKSAKTGKFLDSATESKV